MPLERRRKTVDSTCNCYTCRNFSAAYLHHLFALKIIAYTLATLHNLTFMHNFMVRIRDSISRDGFNSFKDTFLADYQIRTSLFV